MRNDGHLETTVLVDCSGATTHRLTLLIDGRVRVNVGGMDVIVDPGSRTVTPPAFQLGRGEYSHQQVLDLACSLRAF